MNTLFRERQEENLQVEMEIEVYRLRNEICI